MSKLIWAGVVLILVAVAVVWLREDARENLRRQIAAETQRAEVARQAENAAIEAEGATEAAAHQQQVQDLADRLGAAHAEIAQREEGAKCTVSVDTVRAISKAR
jgi:hypothetical protein